MKRLVLLALVGCDEGATPPGDARADAAVVDASADAAGDARVDAAVDAGVDAAADAGPPCTPGPLTEHTVGGWTVAVDSATGAWSATPPDAQAPVLRSPPACTPGLAATRGDLGVRNAFGGFLFDYNPLEELLPVGAPEVEAGVDLALRFGIGLAVLRRHDPRKVVEVVEHQRVPAFEQRGAFMRRALSPFPPGGFGSSDGTLNARKFQSLGEMFDV